MLHIFLILRPKLYITVVNRSPFTHRKGPNGKPYEISQPDTDISFVSSGRPSIDNMFPSFADNYDSGATPPRLSGFSDFEAQNFEPIPLGRRSLDIMPSELSFLSMEGDRASFSSTPVGNRRFLLFELLEIIDTKIKISTLILPFSI